MAPPQKHLRVAVALLSLACCATPASADAPAYAVVVSRQTFQDPAWKQVADTLLAKHNGQLILYETSVRDSLPTLKQLFPRYTCFVATPAQATRQFVADVHRLTRKLDDDPYTDTIWGILTGFDAANALRIAKHTDPLIVHKVASGTDVALDLCEEGAWYCELTQGRMVRKEKGQSPRESKGPPDTTQALVNTLNDDHADLFITSGHATERDWQIGYRYRNGSFRSKAGKLLGVDTQGKTYPIDSPNPKVYLPIGNCLMGHIDSTDAMALAWMNSAAVYQMIGYTVPSWFGYAGWGCLDYFLEQPGRYTFAEAFHANHHALIHRLNTCFPDLAKLEPKPESTFAGPVTLSDAAKRDKITANDGRGLLFDRDVVAFYGDPAWSARMADHDKPFDQSLSVVGDLYTLEIRPRLGDKSFQPVNTNGSQRGFRPFIQFLPHRVKQVQVIEGQELHPVVTDDFVLVPNPRLCDPARAYRVIFRAQPF